MENDECQRGLNIINENEQHLDNVFKLDYLNQKLNDNVEYKKWLNENIQIYGKNYKLFQCSMDKLLFITSTSDCKSYPFYQSICPKCKNPICYFCSRYGRDSYGGGNCCLRRRIYCKLFEDSLRLINPYNNHQDVIFFKDCFTVFIIPGINLLYFMKEMHCAFFYKLGIKNDITGYNGDIHNYEYHIQRNSFNILALFVVINILFALVLSISYIILNTYFIIFILIISLPFKFYPLKYILGIGYARET